jgi:hypothetical protein
MAISYISAAYAAAATVNLPTFQAGDLAVVFAYRNGSTAAPTVPTPTFTSLIADAGANTNARAIGYRILQAGDTTTGTWTNATAIEVIVLRAVNPTTPIGNRASGGTNTATMTLPAVSPLAITNGTSWVIGFGGSKSTNANGMTVTGMTARNGSVTALGLHTAEGVSTFASVSYSSAVNASGNRMDAVEVEAIPTVTGTGALAAGASTLSGAGTLTNPTYAGTGALACGTSSLSGSGTYASGDAPVTSVLDSFTRADGSMGANWGGPFRAAAKTWKILGNHAVPSSTDFPLKLAANNRTLTKQDGTPYLVLGETPWSLISQAPNADVTTYLDDRQARGFNSLIVMMLDHMFADHAPANYYNDAPFTGTAFQSSLNEAYWAHADWVIQQAAAKGMNVFLFPLYLGSSPSEGWSAEVTAASTTNMADYGTTLGNRYKNFPNIVWVVGGDMDPTSWLTKVNSFANALIAADPNHLVSFHDGRGNMGKQHLAGASWLTLNSVYTDSDTHTLSQTAYGTSPTQPFFLIEAWYEHEHSMTPQQLRAQNWWVALGGGTGFFFGNCPMWGLGWGAMNFCDAGAGTWQANLASTGSDDVRHVGTLLASRAWHTLVPDYSHTFVTAGYGSGTTTVNAGVNAAGTLAVAYLPVNATVTIDCTKMAGTYTARWFDPTNGNLTLIGTHSNTGTQPYTSSNNADGTGDQVLLLEVP